MKRPIRSVVEEFGFHTNKGEIISCINKLDDIHPILMRSLSCFAEFAYEYEDQSKLGDTTEFTFDKVTNIKLCEKGDPDSDVFDAFDFDKSKQCMMFFVYAVETKSVSPV